MNEDDFITKDNDMIWHGIKIKIDGTILEMYVVSLYVLKTDQLANLDLKFQKVINLRIWNIKIQLQLFKAWFFTNSKS